MAKEYSKKQEPETVSKYYKLHKKALGLHRTIQRHHLEGYLHAIDEALGGEQNLDDLDNDKKQLDFVNAQHEYLLKKAREYFKTDKELDQLEKDMLIQAYSGASRQALEQIVSTHGKNLDIDQYGLIAKENFLEPVRKQLVYAARNHIKKEHFGDIFDYTSAHDILEQKYMDVNTIAHILDHFKKYGGLNRKVLESEFKSRKYLLKGGLAEPKEEEEKAEEKGKKKKAS